MSDRNTRLNKLYRDEGWGHITDDALGIAPVDVESQARSVASYAAEEIEHLRHDIERYIAIASEKDDEIDRLQARVAELESHLPSQKANPLRASQNDTPEGDDDTSTRADQGA